MKFTRLPNQPKARPAQSRKLPLLNPDPLSKKGVPGVNERRRTATTLQSMKVPDQRPETFLSMTYGLLGTVFCGGLFFVVMLGMSDSNNVGMFLIGSIGVLFLGVGALSSFWFFLKGLFDFLAAQPDNKR